MPDLTIKNAAIIIDKKEPVLITGSSGFIGKNLVARLTAAGFENLLLYDTSSTPEQLEEFTKTAKFIFHLAGVNRPKNPAEFYTGNTDLTRQILDLLQKADNKAPLLFTSSAQAGNNSDYAKSKEQAEQLIFEHMKSNSSNVYVFRLPGVFGKWCKPSYNSVVATFCHNIARGLPVEVRDPNFSLPLCYIDDVINSFVAVLQGRVVPPTPGRNLGIYPQYTVTLGKISTMIQEFKDSRTTLEIPNMLEEFSKKLYATYLSYIPQDQLSYPLTMHTDNRGSFTEFLRSPDRGQVSVNTTKPGVVKGQPWHETKNEKFLVVSGEGIIRFRRVDSDEIFEYKVSGKKMEVLEIPTGTTHNIENIGKSDLVTVMWASEPFNPEHPDTNYQKV